MSWQQDYRFPNLFNLFRIIARRKIKDQDIINTSLRGFGLPLITKVEQIIVEDDPYAGRVYGIRVLLTNGDIYKTVLNEKKSFTQDGNYGCDVYEWKKVSK